VLMRPTDLEGATAASAAADRRKTLLTCHKEMLAMKTQQGALRRRSVSGFVVGAALGCLAVASGEANASQTAADDMNIALSPTIRAPIGAYSAELVIPFPVEQVLDPGVLVAVDKKTKKTIIDIILDDVKDDTKDQEKKKKEEEEKNKKEDEKNKKKKKKPAEKKEPSHSSGYNGG